MVIDRLAFLYIYFLRLDDDKVGEDVINAKINEETPIWELNAAELDTARPDWKIAQVNTYLLDASKLFVHL